MKSPHLASSFRRGIILSLCVEESDATFFSGSLNCFLKRVRSLNSALRRVSSAAIERLAVSALIDRPPYRSVTDIPIFFGHVTLPVFGLPRERGRATTSDQPCVSDRKQDYQNECGNVFQTLRPGDIVTMDNLGSHKGIPRHPFSRRASLLPAKILTRFEPRSSSSSPTAQVRKTNHRGRLQSYRSDPRHHLIGRMHKLLRQRWIPDLIPL